MLRNPKTHRAEPGHDDSRPQNREQVARAWLLRRGRTGTREIELSYLLQQHWPPHPVRTQSVVGVTSSAQRLEGILVFAPSHFPGILAEGCHDARLFPPRYIFLQLLFLRAVEKSTASAGRPSTPAVKLDDMVISTVAEETNV